MASGRRVARYSSRPGAPSVMRTRWTSVPSGPYRTAVAPSRSCPSRNTVAPDRDILPDDGLGGVRATVDHRLNAGDGNAAEL